MAKTIDDMPVDGTRQRLDILLVGRGLAASRDRARDLIISGAVTVDGQLVQKPAKACAGTSVIEIKLGGNPWVSRAGLKLAGAITGFNELDVSGCKALDIGASTGGFTDVLLAHGADHVVAVDVGHGQLHQRLAADDRVTVLDDTKARYLTASILPYLPDIIVCDASFISLQKLLPAALGLAKAGARLVALVKPQFEVGKGLVGKGGIVRDPALHQQVVTGVVHWLETDMHWHVLQTMPSPITGPDGNVEFLLLAKKPD
ncbi:MAG: TlyA family RNA methyltransferase [Proteobacteria bacterium]|nr:TlyA family RNA methyltransferase [Pseudomonadota bacterium]MDA0844377.1 TlyA family RNA methyltransferase [Pseudomonadota bacterium]